MSEFLIIEGKQYISASRAAEIAEYSKDYVGQLCRSGKLVCRMVGRFWYVDEKSLRRHKEEAVKVNHTSFGYNGFASRASFSDNNVLNDSYANSRIHGNGAVQHDLNSGHFFAAALKQTFIVFITIAAIFSFGFIVVSASRPLLPQTFSQTFSQTLGDNAASAYSAIVSAGSILGSEFDNAYSTIASIFHPASSNSSAAVALSSSTNDFVQNENYSVANAGLVVVPYSTTSETNTKLEQTITNSFSDNVTVSPGPNGTTGVITPEFKNVAGNDFLYMLVPVKATTTATTSQN